MGSMHIWHWLIVPMSIGHWLIALAVVLLIFGTMKSN